MGYDGGKSGISEYINQVTEHLCREHRVDLLILEQDREVFPLPESDNLRFITYSNRYAKPALNMLWHSLVLPFRINFSEYDFVFLPAGNRRLFGRCPKPCLVTFHDLSQFHIPGKYDALRMFYIKKIVPALLKRTADLVFAVSSSTKRDIVEYYHYPADKIEVNYNGYNAGRFGNAEVDGEAVREKYGLTKPYILYVARIEHPGKNHLNLIKAYEQLPEALKVRYDMAFAGSKWLGGEAVIEYWEQSPDKERIKLLGFVENAHLPGLYRGASIYAFPSFFEGFGIPLLEALSSGVPAVCANTSSLPEVGGGAVLTFSPDSPEEIRDRLVEVMENPGLREEMIAKGYEQVKKFSWEIHTRKILEGYERETGKN